MIVTMDSVTAQIIQTSVAASVPTLAVFLAAILSNSRISDLRADTTARISDLRDHMDTRFDEMRDTWRSELRRVEDVLDARLKRLEERERP